MSFLLGILFLLLGLVVSIALHELGHLIPAKKFKTLVPEYMVGFGKLLWKKQYGETSYGIKAILLGGYCRILGMYGPATGDTVVYHRGREKITAHQATQMDDQELSELKPTLAQGAREQSLAEIPLGQEHRAFYLLPVWKKLIVMFSGPFMNLVLCVVFLTIAMSGIGIYQPSTKMAGAVCYNGSQSALCSHKKPDWKPSVAARAGLQPGDQILTWAGQKVNTWDQLKELASRSRGDVQVTILRAGEQKTLLFKGL